MPYHSVSVVFEHTFAGSDTRRVNQAVLTVYGESEFAMLAELRRQHPSYEHVVVLEFEVRS